MPANLRHTFRYLLLGKNQFILSHAEYKRVLLTGQLCLIAFVVSISYLIIDLASGFSNPWPFQLACSILLLVSLWLNRSGRFTLAKLVLSLSVNFTVFVFASGEPFETGLYVYFIAANLGAFTIYGYEERHKALFLVALSTVLFFVSVYYKNNFIVPDVIYTKEYMVTNVVINYIGTSCASLAVIYFLININHHSESALRKNEKEIMAKNGELTRLNVELDRFVYSTSHDLRAPLSSVHGLLQLIDMSDDPAERKKYFEFIRRRVDDLDKFIREIADVARNVQQQISVERINVRELIGESLETLRFFPESKSVKVILEIPEGQVIISDRMRLQMIMNNLISNAFKYKDSAKAENHIRIASRVENDRIQFLVEDNGIGIPEDSVKKIFDMYMRAHEQSNGSGLGLYIVKETVERLKGKVFVQSEVGGGSCFTIDIPMREEEMAKAQA